MLNIYKNQLSLIHETCSDIKRKRMSEYESTYIKVLWYHISEKKTIEIIFLFEIYFLVQILKQSMLIKPLVCVINSIYETNFYNILSTCCD